MSLQKDSQLDCCNFAIAGISFFSNVEKILENLKYKRVYNFLTENNIIYDLQFHDGYIGRGIFADLQKAFEIVDHQIMPSKLDYYGIRGTSNNWLKSYRSNR